MFTKQVNVGVFVWIEKNVWKHYFHNFVIYDWIKRIYLIYIMLYILSLSKENNFDDKRQLYLKLVALIAKNKTATKIERDDTILTNRQLEWFDIYVTKIMPVILLERIPLPSLRTYTSISVLLLSCSVFYAYQCVQTFQPTLATDLKDPTYNVDASENLEQQVVDPDVLKEPLSDEFELQLPYESFWWNVFYVLTSEIWCVWVGQHDKINYLYIITLLNIVTYM